MSEKISTSALAKMRNIDAKLLFSDLKRAGYITRQEDKWILTEEGAKFGGEYVDHPKFGPFIVWPTSLHIELNPTSGKTLSATQLGDKLRLNAKRINQLLSELGWISKSEDGWQVTEAGIRAGGQQRADKESQNTFVVWHDVVLRNKRLKQSVVEFLGQDAESHSTDKSYSSFRQKFEAKHRTLDGHYVRSKGELLIDNWLYLAGIVHAYERQLPIEQEVMSDFYLPAGKLYLQFWGSDSGETPEIEREAIRAVYQQHNFNLIEVEPSELDKLDEVLPKRLRQFGIQAY
ncbi:glycerol kinase [Vibrio parahaemolyticus]|uniref:glycerol kinase n=1 Tax=Vibrio parahaemolyticus TaxID=670 RepID=UPI00111F75D2|nr:glycerol kinase [Vibrio parahaemolyticus]EHZ2643988.1 glycerol kinase [Vibrio parahaemolyticus]EHZ2648090.1 glycerol kinase [Vibrio parahaemolyticus]ELM4064611.1 glycerol kinase [Vibrio parahaemolyticus]ELM4067384.1 glycerol kinase [Vibrio parahaemolyticus]MBE5159253.1 glycerol kinase [Vibrio parahaemolyticus]